MSRQICVVFVLLIFISGCSWFRPHSSKDASNGPPVSLYIDSGKVFYKDKLREGGKIAVIAFSAGENIEADEELDKIALMIIRGLADSLETSPLEVVFEDEAKEADFIIEGHVTKMLSPSKLKRWVMQKRKIELGVEGKMVDQKNGKTVAVFTDSQRGRADYRQLGFAIGQDIGNFLRQQMQ